MIKRVHVLCLLLFFFYAFSCIGQNVNKEIKPNVLMNYENNLAWKEFVGLIKRMEKDESLIIPVMHIGDSHVQGGYFPNRFRELLDKNYKLAGRGWVFPYSLAEVNGPEDVVFSSIAHWISEKYTRLSTSQQVHISGYHLHSSDSILQLTLRLTADVTPSFHFNELEIYHSSQISFSGNGSRLVQREKNNLCGFKVTGLKIPTTTDSVSLIFKNINFRQQDFSLYGINLKSSDRGFLYHAIGVNGASYDSYLRFINFKSTLNYLEPALVIISLGTNDAYMSKIDGLQFKKKVVSLIDSVRAQLPGACVLLTTPGDHLRGKKFLNPNLSLVRDEIVQAAIEKDCLYWDFFTLMGGLGASKKWKAHGDMFSDMIHLSRKGYALQGELFFEAFQKAIQCYKRDGDN